MIDWSVGIGQQIQEQDPLIPRYLIDLCVDHDPPTFSFDHIYIQPKMCLCAQIPGTDPSFVEYINFYQLQPRDTGLVIDLLIKTIYLIADLEALQNNIFPIVNQANALKFVRVITPIYDSMYSKLIDLRDSIHDLIKDYDDSFPTKFVPIIRKCGLLLRDFTEFVRCYLQNEEAILTFSWSESSNYKELADYRTLVELIKSPFSWLKETITTIKKSNPSFLSEEDRKTRRKYLAFAGVIVATLESMPQLERIASQFVSQPFQIIKPGRRFIKEGEALKQCRKKADPRHLVLFSDYFVYAQVLKGQYLAAASYELIRFRADIFEFVGRHGINLYAPKKSFLILFPNEGERDEWLMALQEAIQMAKESCPFEIEQYWESPVWIPDDFTDQCMICNCEFGFMNRKHHCRSCGHIICSNCSPHKIVIPWISTSSPARVCKECVERAKKKNFS